MTDRDALAVLAVAAVVAALFAIWREMYLLRKNRDILFPRRRPQVRRRKL